MSVSDPSVPSASQFIEATISRLQALSAYSVQSNWYTLTAPPSAHEQGIPSRHTAVLATLNHRQHIAWPKGKQCLWLYQTLKWPDHVNGFSVEGYTAKLALRWWAESADIYVNGEWIQSGDLFDCFTRVTLDPAVQPGQAVEIALRLISPGHDDGALVRSHLTFESTDEAFPEPSFVADEIAVLYRYLKRLQPEQLDVLANQLGSLSWPTDLPYSSNFSTALAQLRQQLMPWSHWIKQRHIHCIGHAHLDLAWLWPISDTWEAAERTFKSVMALQQDFPELTYTHSSPALFAWLEENRPELFRAVQNCVQQGQWSIDAGLWVEPELNLISGESIVRQILYGQRYCQEKFGQISQIAWLPDTFGFSWQLPQLLTQGGIRCFATQKLRWNDTNDFPYDWFWWQGLDGTSILSLTLPPIGTDIEPLEIADYASKWEFKTGLSDSLWLPGVGDHGGGPTRDMLMRSQRWAQSPFFPNLSFTSTSCFLQKLESNPHQKPEPDTNATPPQELPVWNDELYLELHRGCYTSHADQKWYNHRCENLLYQAELFSSIAALVADCPYPKAELEAAWKNVLFNQFHDILPGTAIPEVFTEANQLWAATAKQSHELLESALGAISGHIELSPPFTNAVPVVVFNSLNWSRTEVAILSIADLFPSHTHWKVYDSSGKPVLSQLVQENLSIFSCNYPPVGPESAHLLFYAENIPSIGYRLFWLVPEDPATQNNSTISNQTDTWVLENAFLKISIDPQSGDLSSLYDKQHQRELIEQSGNKLEAFTDEDQYWDAWNIAPDYQKHPKPPAKLHTIEWLEKGSLRQCIRVIRQLNQSTFWQDYILEESSNILKIRTNIDWQESQTLVKTAFYHFLRDAKATYEIPYGAIERAICPTTTEEAAKWEVPALNWVDISQADYGFSFLTSSKHGFDTKPNCLRLSLLKAPVWPDPSTDRGQQYTTFALYPHDQTWKEAHSAHYARAFNLPLQAFIPVSTKANKPKTLPSSQAFLEFSKSYSLILSALKQSETEPTQYILRCYEPYGLATTSQITNPLKLKLTNSVDLLEEHNPRQNKNVDGNGTLSLQPWEVVNLRLEVSSPEVNQSI